MKSWVSHCSQQPTARCFPPLCKRKY